MICSRGMQRQAGRLRNGKRRCISYNQTFGHFAPDAQMLERRTLRGRVCKAKREGATMAVQQNKKSPSKRGMHRSHDALDKPGLAIEPTTGEVHLRHHISASGFYRGRQVIKPKDQD